MVYEYVMHSVRAQNKRRSTTQLQSGTSHSLFSSRPRMHVSFQAIEINRIENSTWPILTFYPFRHI